MRQKKTIALLVGLLIFGAISQASNFPFSKLNFGNSRAEQKSYAPTHSENLPLQEEHGSISSTTRASLEEDEDDTANEKKLATTTFTRSEFRQEFYFLQNVFETLDLEILTPPPQK